MKQLVLPAGSRSDDTVVLTGKEHHYLAHVRRLSPGDRIKALDQGKHLLLEVVEVNPDRLTLAVREVMDAEVSDRCQIVLFPCLLKSRKLDDVIRQAAEAGVSEVVPVVGDHSISRVSDGDDGPRRAQRWNQIAIEAAQQSGNHSVCRVSAPVASREIPRFWNRKEPLLFFHEKPLDKSSLHGYLFPRPASVGIIVGPEGGLSTQEVAGLREGGALPVWLGPFVLRAETASLYAIASVNTILQESSEWIIPT